MSQDANSELASVLYAFHYEVMDRTQSLYALLGCTETAHNMVLSLPVASRPLAERVNTRSFNTPTYSLAFPMVTGFDGLDITCREGRAEQLAYRGWFTDVYGLWDYYREQLHALFEAQVTASDLIKPEADAFGDLRLIRQDIVHHKSVASSHNTGRCKLLTWFEPGAPMVFRLSHVLNLLHQMGILKQGLSANLGHNGITFEIASWTGYSIDALRSWQPVPKIVSVRSDFFQIPDSEQAGIHLSLLYENGFFFDHSNPVDNPSNTRQRLQLHDLIRRTQLMRNGDVIVPALSMVLTSEEAYVTSVDAYESMLNGTAGDAVVPPMGGPLLLIRRQD